MVQVVAGVGVRLAVRVAVAVGVRPAVTVHCTWASPARAGGQQPLLGGQLVGVAIAVLVRAGVWLGVGVGLGRRPVNLMISAVTITTGYRLDRVGHGKAAVRVLAPQVETTITTRNSAKYRLVARPTEVS